MSRQFRYRLTALGLSGLVLGAPLFIGGTANAGPLDGNDRQVSFGGGGVFGVPCVSRPDVEAMTVPSGSMVRVVNRTGHAAKLRLAGSPRGTIPADGVAEVVFRRGATPVLLTPVCAFGADEGLSVLVTTAPSPSPTEPDPDRGRPGDDAVTVVTKSAGKGSSRTSASSERSGPAAAVSRPVRTAKKDSRRGKRHPAGPAPVTSARTAATTATTAQPVPRDGVSARSKARPRPRPLAGTQNEAPVLTGMPPGGRRAALPGASSGSAVSYRAGAVPPLSDADYVAAVGLEPETADLSAAASVSGVGHVDDGPPVGLLAMTAVVCVLGVATAAIRAIVSQRASRANMA